MEEFRQLEYVALSRARNNIYLLNLMSTQSEFNTELISRDSNGKVRVVYATGLWDQVSKKFYY